MSGPKPLPQPVLGDGLANRMDWYADNPGRATRNPEIFAADHREAAQRLRAQPKPLPPTDDVRAYTGPDYFGERPTSDEIVDEALANLRSDLAEIRESAKPLPDDYDGARLKAISAETVDGDIRRFREAAKPLPPTDDVRALIADLEDEVENDTRAQEALDDPTLLQEATERRLQARDKLLAALSAQSPPPIMGEGLEDLFSRCGWPMGEVFTFYDEPGAHDPCYVVMPGGASLPLNHHNGEGVDIARAKFIIAACNAALGSSPKAITDAASHLEVCARLEEIGERREGPGNAAIHRRHAAALRSVALATPSLPEGMVMVPREPEVSDDMLNAGQERLCQIRSITHFDDEAQAEIFSAMFKAMIATAPASALRMGKGVES